MTYLSIDHVDCLLRCDSVHSFTNFGGSITIRTTYFTVQYDVNKTNKMPNQDPFPLFGSG